MKKLMTLLTIFFFVSINNVYSQMITIPIKDLGLKMGEKIYLKKVNYFHYFKDDFILDSLRIKSKYIEFKKDSIQSLFLVSKDKSIPSTYIPFREMPNIYHYMFCSRFYSKYNYLILNKSYNKNEYRFLKQFYKDFANHNFDENLSDSNGYIKMDVKDVELEIKKRGKYFTEKIENKKKKLSKEFIEYLETEIELGAMNQFLNWYEGTYKNEINSEFSLKNASSIHEKYYSKFFTKKWNRNSVQYFRTIERILNYEQSKINKKFNVFHERIEMKNEKRQEIIKNTASNRVDGH